MILAKMKGLGHYVNVVLISVQLTSIKCARLLMLLALQSKRPMFDSYVYFFKMLTCHFLLPPGPTEQEEFLFFQGMTNIRP